MNILDENILKSQRLLLERWRVPIKQIGVNVGHKGLQDEEIIPFLHSLRQPTLFTRDEDFYDPKLRHANYSLVYLAVAKEEAAIFVRDILRHPALKTKVQRMGTVVRASTRDISAWRVHAEKESHIQWR